MNRSTSAAEKWRGIVVEQASSKQTVAEYCRQRGIAASSLFAWKRRLKRVAGAAAFVEATLKPAEGVRDEPQAGIEIVCASGRRVTVRKGFDPEALKQVIATLEMA
jgi:transposase-like protein